MADHNPHNSPESLDRAPTADIDTYQEVTIAPNPSIQSEHTLYNEANGPQEFQGPQEPQEPQEFQEPQEPREPQNGWESLNTEPVRTPRVRFRSISHQQDVENPFETYRVDTDPSEPRQRFPSDRSTDLVDVTLAPTASDDDLPPPPPSIPASDESEDEKIPQRTESAKGRWKAAGQLLRQKTVRLGERLGRPAEDGETLGASLLPEDLEMGMPRLDEVNDEKALDEKQEEALPAPSAEAHRLVRSMTRAQQVRRRKPRPAYARSGTSTSEEGRTDSSYDTRRFSGGGGILSQLLKLHASQMGGSKDSFSVTDTSDTESPVSSGAATPLSGAASGTATPKKQKLKWYKKSNHHSTASLVEASMNLSRTSLPSTADAMSVAQNKPKPKKGKKRKTRLEDEIRVTIHIAEILARQRYIMQLCRALMRYGAPTHRLEEYMQMTAKVLEVEGQFLYLPGCMMMSFDDPSTRTAEVKLVRVVQGVDLGRLADTHNVYKNVVHDLYGVEEAIQELDLIMKGKPRFNKWILVPTYGLASVAVGPFAFGARPIDMPIIFFLGSLVGLMQHVLAPRSVLYSNVFEVSAAVLTSFLARAFGSISITDANGDSHRLFCFSALAQSSIALILPGFLVLCSSLELQSHQIIAGSIRMVYSIIYSLFLGYGITVGTTIYGLLDGDASSQTTCSNLDVWGSEYAQRFPFVAIYVVFLVIINQGKWKQTPVMMVIAVCGYVTNYFSTKKLGSNSEVANTVGAFTIGLLGNLYSRLWHGHAATAILPGIFVLVPSGLASSGSLISGVEYANSVRENLISGNGTATSTQDTSIASLGFGMIQVAIGITVGLFISALIVYPYGKRRSGLFSF